MKSCNFFKSGLLGLAAVMVLVSGVWGVEHSGKGYTIEYRNWYKTKFPQFDVMFLAPENKVGTYHENVSVAVAPYPYPVNWEAIKASHIAYCKTIIGDFKLKSWGNARISGVDGKKIQYTGLYSGMKLIWVQYFVIKNKQYYVVSYIAGLDEFSTYLAEAEKIIESFRIK